MLTGWLLVTVGSCLAVGARTGSVVLVAAILIPTLALLIIDAVRRENGVRIAAHGAGTLALLFALVVFLVATNPLARIDVLQWLFDAVSNARAFPWVETIRTLGQDLNSTDLPWWYVPVWVLAQLPLVTSVAVLMGLGFVGYDLVARKSRHHELSPRTMLPLIVQGLAVPAAAVMASSVFYDGIRHLLFIIPALIGVAAYGIARIEGTKTNRSTWFTPRFNASAFAILVTVLGLWANARWFPYMYAYINPLAGIRQDQRDWELDYWGVTSLEGVRELTDMGAGHVTIKPINGAPDIYGRIERPPSVRDQRLRGEFVFHRWEAEIDTSRCTKAFSIARDGHVLGEGALCTD